MKPKSDLKCPSCSSSSTSIFRIYNTVHNGGRQLLRCEPCNRLFAETSNTAMENLKTPISKVASALRLRSEGLGLQATGRVLDSHKGTIAKWEKLFANHRPESYTDAVFLLSRICFSNILRLKMRQQGERIALSGEKQTLTQKQKMDCNEL